MMLLIELTLWIFLSGAICTLNSPAAEIVFMFIGMGTVWYLFTKGGEK